MPGKGLPLGRRYWRFYLKRRQAVIWGAFLLVVSVLVTLAGIGAGKNDALLFPFLVGWLGGLYVFHGVRMKSEKGSSPRADLSESSGKGR